MRGSLASSFWCRSLSAAVAGLVLCVAVPVRADLIVSVESVTASAGSTGNTLEVDVTNTGPSSVDVAAFSFEISVPSASGVTLTGADINTSLATYIFDGNSAQGPNIATATGTTLDASDNAASGSTTLGAGVTLGLGRVFFDVASSASGVVPVTLSDFPATSLTAPTGDNIPINTLTNGTITITSPAAVPEPSTLVSASVLGILGGAWLIRRQGRAQRATCV
jgi:hypothetical protein